ncbi:transmembrane protein 17B [Drosophila biarmipes]|uniref:transmembrane protein 17B n=1 Tax=Drosophila biarmipes TaxID=125945 RepID=UPI0007E7E558|nr:transmembrane protein 17B [Drosophila biarmipes]
MAYSVSPHRANLVLQMLLQANTYVSMVWAMSYLIHMLIRLKQLWNLEGLAMLVAYILAVSAESVRLYAGYSVNLCSGATAMWLLLTVTPCILLPAMVFLRLSAAGRSLWLRIITNAVFALMGLEVIVSLVHFVICKPRRKRPVPHHQAEEEEEDLPEEQPSAVGSPTSSEQKRRVRRSPESK